MFSDSARKWSYYNVGLCKWIKKTWTIPKCTLKVCPNRHPKEYKYGEICSFQSRCCYKYEKEIRDLTQISDLEKEVDILITEINALNKKNNDMINILAKVHLNDQKHKIKQILKFQLLRDLQEIKQKLLMTNKLLMVQFWLVQLTSSQTENFRIQTESNREYSTEGNESQDINCVHWRNQVHKKNAVKDILVYRNKVFTCAICGKEFKMLENLTRQALAHVIKESIDLVFFF